MKLSTFPLITIVLLLSCLFVKCNTTPDAIKFNKAGWKLTEDLNAHPNRERMLKDLVEHHKIQGLTYHQLIDSLGKPDHFDNIGNSKDSIQYEIVTNYGYLDPKSGKYLAIGLSKDSVTTGFKVVEWKNRHANE